MTSRIYSKLSLTHHPGRLEDLRSGGRCKPLHIHLMPQNLCNHDCHFCSYRLSNWKNSELFDDKQQIPWEVLEPALEQARELGVEAIEWTGGGEPLIYRWREALLDKITELRFDLGLVTNGTAVTDDLADRIAAVPGWKWARVSIDAGERLTYMKVRDVKWNHWDRAWGAVSRIRERMTRPDQRLGCGFVLTHDNFSEVLRFCRTAKLMGADNVRLGLRFGPEANDYYEERMLATAIDQAQEAKRELEDETFSVHDVFASRLHDQEHMTQDYASCYTKDLVCVIGGDSCVYTCCTLAFTPSGKVGDLRERSFKEIWGQHQFFKTFDPRKRCQCQCVYRDRNLAMIEMVRDDHPPEPDPDAIHTNFA